MRIRDVVARSGLKVLTTSVCCKKGLTNGDSLRESLEHAFHGQEVGSHGSQVSKKFDVGVVKEVIDVDPDAQWQTEATQFVGRTQVDEFDLHPLISINDGRKANEIIVDSLNSREKPEICRSPQMLPGECTCGVEEMTRTELQYRVISDVSWPCVGITQIC